MPEITQPTPSFIQPMRRQAAESILHSSLRYSLLQAGGSQS